MKTVISKRKFVALTRYQLLGNWSMYISMGVTLAVNFTVAVLIGALSHESGGGNIDAVMLAMSAATGVVLCTSGFKFALVNGASRKTYFFSALAGTAAIATAYGLITGLAMMVTHTVGHSSDIYYYLYLMHGAGWGGMFAFELSACLFMAALGLFLAFVFYRTGRRGRLILLVAVLAGAALLTLIGFFTDLWPAVLKGLKALFGFTFAVPNPFIAMATLLGLSAVLLTATYFLSRRADLR